MTPRIDIRPDHLEIVCTILREHVPDRGVLAFGSRATWTAKEYSDLDLAVLGNEPLTLDITSALTEEFSESDLPFKVDIVEWARVDENFRDKLRRNGVVVQTSVWRSNLRKGPYGPIAKHYRETTLKNLCVPGNGIQTGPFGSQLHQRDYVDDGTPIITVEHLNENRIVHRNLPRVSYKDKKRLSKYCLRLGDIVFSRVGSVDRRALVRATEEGWLFSGRCLRVRPNPEYIDSTWLSYFFGLAGFRHYIRSIAVGATMPSLNTQLLSDVVVPYPPLTEQRAIARILESLDEKIEINRHMNKTLEEMAQALFKSWFVDFDPVLAKKEGRDTGLPKQIEDLFPSRLADSELGEIPEGWEVRSLQQFVRVVKGTSYRKFELQDSETGLVSLKSFARGGGYRADGLKPYIGTFKPEQVIVSGDVVVACTDVTQAGEVIGRAALIPNIQNFDTLVASLDVLIIRPSMDYLTKSFLYYLCGTERWIRHTSAYATGTTVLHLSKLAVPQYRFPTPTPELVSAFTSVVEGFHSQILLHLAQSEVILGIRETLLPKLITGNIRLPIFDESTDCLE